MIIIFQIKITEIKKSYENNRCLCYDTATILMVIRCSKNKRHLKDRSISGCNYINVYIHTQRNFEAHKWSSILPKLEIRLCRHHFSFFFYKCINLPRPDPLADPGISSNSTLRGIGGSGFLFFLFLGFSADTVLKEKLVLMKNAHEKNSHFKNIS